MVEQTTQDNINGMVAGKPKTDEEMGKLYFHSHRSFDQIENCKANDSIFFNYDFQKTVRLQKDLFMKEMF